VAIENAHFHQRTLAWERLESDLANARLVQRSLLPQQMPAIEGYTLAMRSVTCYAVGGDLLDIIPTSAGPIHLLVADVAGKGLASALVTTSFRSAFRAMVNSGIPLLEIATRMNLLHWSEGEQSRRRYVTAFFYRTRSGDALHEDCQCGSQSCLSGPSAGGEGFGCCDYQDRGFGDAGGVDSVQHLPGGDACASGGEQTAGVYRWVD
jgi:serine phosphatase RsbU (regulator of sigma subunit)